MKKVILASQSPRRKELLSQAGIEFDIITSDVEEKIIHTKPSQIAESLSSQKATDVYNKLIDRYGDQEAKKYLVIGADTIVAIGDRILGKPKDREDAYVMMKLLSGNTHQVYTGVTIVTGSEDIMPYAYTFHQCTEVTFYDITEEEINQYLDGGNEWADKAGGYGVQETVGAKFVKHLNGDYNNVVGLPVARLYQELKRMM